MAGTATIVGGAKVTLSLDPAEYAAAQQALSTMGKGYTQGFVLDDMGDAPVPGALNIYNVTDGDGRSHQGGHNHDGDDIYHLKAGAQGIVLTGDEAATIIGRGIHEVLIGNQGNDTIDAAGGTGTVIAGDGNNLIRTGNSDGLTIIVGKGDNTIDLQHGNDLITTLGGKQTINLTGDVKSAVIGGSGDRTINDTDNAAGGAAITVSGGHNTIYTNQDTSIHATTGVEVHQSGHGTLDFVGAGDDLLYLGSGDDTVVEAGAATVHGGKGQLWFQGGVGNESVQAGSGDATLFGGSGHDFFAAGGGFTTMIAGTGDDTFVGGSHSDLIDGQGAKSNVFEFDRSAHGGFHAITNFTEGRDKIDLVGYDTTSAFNHAQAIGGNTVIMLDSGKTEIVLTGFTNLQKSDFTH
jgi:Ca2+-binding RTX toxin-like protein